MSCQSMILGVLLVLPMLTGLGIDAMAMTRHYYIAAEEEMWDFAPKGQDLIHEKALPAPYHTQ